MIQVVHVLRFGFFFVFFLESNLESILLNILPLIKHSISAGMPEGEIQLQTL